MRQVNAAKATTRCGSEATANYRPRARYCPPNPGANFFTSNCQRPLDRPPTRDYVPTCKRERALPLGSQPQLTGPRPPDNRARAGGHAPSGAACKSRLYIRALRRSAHRAIQRQPSRVAWRLNARGVTGFNIRADDYFLHAVRRHGAGGAFQRGRYL